LPWSPAARVVNDTVAKITSIEPTPTWTLTSTVDVNVNVNVHVPR
jgi:hypothetical protein